MDRDLFLNSGIQFEPHWNWEKSNDYSQFESALAKLGGGFSAAAMTAPLNSPITDILVNENLPQIRNSMPLNPNLTLLAEDPGFAERAARFSCFNERSNQFESNVSPVTATGKFPRVSSSPAMKTDRSPVGFEENGNSDEINMKLSRLSASAANSNEESSVSEQVPSRELGITNPKRKRGSTATKGEEATDDESKRLKKTDQESCDKTTKPPEPPKDYIHVRARRGQATDSHSLAERVRREKISERMKHLQNLVPNCNKVTGKALMLDEIINYVQSLQRQVEFLSMKLSTVDFATNDLISQNINPSNGSLCQEISTFYQKELINGSVPMTGLTQSVYEFTEHFRRFGQDDLQSIVRMGFSENLVLDASIFHPTVDQPSNMKTEL